MDEFTFPPPQAGRRVEQLGACRAEDEQRDAARPVDEVVDEVEQRVVGPVQVLEDEDERALVGERLEEAAPRRERLVAPRRRTSSSVSRPASGRRCRSIQPASRVVADESLDGLPELLLRLLRTVGLEDPGLRLDHLAERPERHAFAVRKRAAVAPVDEPEVSGLDRLEELEDEPALADARDADERDELRLAARGSRGRRSRAGALSSCVAADERRAADAARRRRAHVPAAPPRRRPDPPCPWPRSTAARRTRSRARSRGYVVSSTRMPFVGAADLQTRRRVDDVARGHALAGLRAGVERDERLAGRDPDADLELAVLGERVADRERRPHRALRVVLVCDRGAEDGHHGVADELLDGAAEALELASGRVRGRAGAAGARPPGPSRSARAVKPTRSQKRQVTTLRSSRCASGAE